MQKIILKDNESLSAVECKHNFQLQASVSIEGIIYDIYYCTKCLTHAKKERPCPLNLEEIN